MFKRLVIMVCNVLFPPVAVMLLTGVGEDLLVNSLLFLLAVIPSHVHGFYMSMTYFSRKRKVRKGVYPGDKRSGIWSEKVNNGGASRREVARLKAERDHGKTASPSTTRKSSDRVDNWDDGFEKHAEALSRQNSLGRQNTLDNRRTSRPTSRPAPQRQLTQGSSHSRPNSRTRSRSRSLTRQLSNALGEQVSRRLTQRQERRQRRDGGSNDDDDDEDESSYVDVGNAPIARHPSEVRRWR